MALQVLNSHDSVIYVLAPLKYATIYGCSDATIVLGAIGKVGMMLYDFTVKLFITSIIVGNTIKTKVLHTGPCPPVWDVLCTVLLGNWYLVHPPYQVLVPRNVSYQVLAPRGLYQILVRGVLVPKPEPEILTRTI